MLTTVTYRHLDSRPQYRELVEEMSESLSRYFWGILSVEWTFEAVRQEVVAKCAVRTRRGAYRAQGQAKTLRESVHQAVEKLTAQRRRQKKVRESRKRRRPQKE